MRETSSCSATDQDQEQEQDLIRADDLFKRTLDF